LISCRQITTYQGRGGRKPGIHPEEHALVFAAPAKKAPALPSGEPDFPNKPIRVELTKDKLDPNSRINYAKSKSIEYNYMVNHIGDVDKRYHNRLLKSYNAVANFARQPNIGYTEPLSDSERE
jgi:hypothetical protein